jgi:hypothetical protein
MEYNWGFAQKIQCSQEERQQCVELAADMVDLATKGRRSGLMALMQEAEENPSFLLRKGLQLILDGVKPDIVREILEFHIGAGNYSGRELLERCLILEGVLALQNGVHPKIVKELMMSLLGEDGQKGFEAKFDQKDDQEFKAFLQNIKDTHPPSAPAKKLDKAINKMTGSEIHLFLKEINTTDLARAIKDLGGKTQLKILSSMPKRAASMLQHEIECIDSVDETEMQTVYEKVETIIAELKTRSELRSTD